MCPKCGSLRYAKDEQKTALCFKCHYHVPIVSHKIKIIYKTDERGDAIKVLQKLKMKQGE